MLWSASTYRDVPTLTIRGAWAGARFSRAQQIGTTAPGFAGGEPGAPSRFSLERDSVVMPVSPQSSAIATEIGDRLIAETPGGGGFGLVAARGQPHVVPKARPTDD